MKLRAYAPALLALAALVALYLYVTRDSQPAAAPEQPAPPVATAPAPAAPAPAPTPPPSAPETAAEGPPATIPHALTPDEYAGHEGKPKKPKMTLDEKLAETRTHIEVMEKRAKLLEAEIAELERTGQSDKAAEQRIVLQRLKAHADKLREDVAARREPE